MEKLWWVLRVCIDHQYDLSLSSPKRIPNGCVFSTLVFRSPLYIYLALFSAITEPLSHHKLKAKHRLNLFRFSRITITRNGVKIKKAAASRSWNKKAETKKKRCNGFCRRARGRRCQVVCSKTPLGSGHYCYSHILHGRSASPLATTHNNASRTQMVVPWPRSVQ